MATLAYSAPAPIPHPALERARLHRRLSALVERLIGVLDGLDADPDLEDTGDDEPSLAHPETLPWDSQARAAAWLPIGGTQFTDLEWACEDEGAITGDDEPEVGE